MEQRWRRLMGNWGLTPTTMPAADIYETEDEFVVQLEVPGYDEQELEVTVTDHRLTVKGERKEETEKEEKAFRVRERLEKQFERQFEFPPEADLEQLRAQFAKGVLEIHAPKSEKTTPRKIEISTS